VANRFRLPQIPNATQLLSPWVGLENAVINVVMAPARMLGLNIPAPPGPMSVVSQAASVLPNPPQIPELPELPKLPGQ